MGDNCRWLDEASIDVVGVLLEQYEGIDIDFNLYDLVQYPLGHTVIIY